MLTSTRWATPRWPRFVVSGLHRNVTLLALAFVGVHVLTTVLDGYAPIGLQDAVSRSSSRYRPIWLGLGAVAFDLLLAVIVTSLLRARLGYRAWRLVHWLAYASWPVALVHALGTGSDARAGWFGLLAFVSVASRRRRGPLAGARVARRQARRAWRPPRLALVLPVTIGIWAASGPLQRGWAARAGTPPTLLAARSVQVTKLVTVSAAAFAARGALHDASLSGSVSQSSGADRRARDRRARRDRRRRREGRPARRPAWRSAPGRRHPDDRQQRQLRPEVDSPGLLRPDRLARGLASGRVSSRRIREHAHARRRPATRLREPDASAARCTSHERASPWPDCRPRCRASSPACRATARPLGLDGHLVRPRAAAVRRGRLIELRRCEPASAVAAARAFRPRRKLAGCRRRPGAGRSSSRTAPRASRSASRTRLLLRARAAPRARRGRACRGRRVGRASAFVAVEAERRRGGRLPRACARRTRGRAASTAA